jgi:hypothetical protein
MRHFTIDDGEEDETDDMPRREPIDYTLRLWTIELNLERPVNYHSSQIPMDQTESMPEPKSPKECMEGVTSAVPNS